MDNKIVVSGIITKIYRKKIKNNKTAAIFELDDTRDTIKVLVFPKIYELSETFLVEGEAVLVEGFAETDETSVLIADRITQLNILEPT